MILHLVCQGDDETAVASIRAMGAGTVVILSGPSPALPATIEVVRSGEGGLPMADVVKRIEAAEKIYCW